MGSAEPLPNAHSSQLRQVVLLLLAAPLAPPLLADGGAGAGAVAAALVAAAGFAPGSLILSLVEREGVPACPL